MVLLENLMKKTHSVCHLLNLLLSIIVTCCCDDSGLVPQKCRQVPTTGNQVVLVRRFKSPGSHVP